jgi:ABC-type antimicrobial peptide transport system permease subunit
VKDIDEQVYEIGIMRMMGESKRDAILMIIMQALMLSLPPVLLGFIASIPLMNLLDSMVFHEDNGVVVSYKMMLQTVMIGTWLPMISTL